MGLLFIAVQLSDLVYGFTIPTGIEKVSFIAGTNLNTSVQYFFPYSHSLVATLLWTGLFALIFLISPLKSDLPKRRTAVIVAIAVFSHFILDVIVHNPDVDLLGNSVYKIGLGLWNYPLASYTIEALLLVVGLWIYLRATKAISLIGKRHANSHCNPIDTWCNVNVHCANNRHGKFCINDARSLFQHDSPCVLFGPQKKLKESKNTSSPA